jgi:ABC-type transport system involved in multi-copper enzyme maturation permease subunit
MDTILRGIRSIFLYEARRLLRPASSLLSCALLLFPALMFFVVGRAEAHVSAGAGAALLFIAYPQVICVLSVLLRSPTLVNSELEAGTWVYLVSRPAGRVALLLGKYLASATFAALGCGLSVTLSAFVLMGSEAARGVLPAVLAPTLLAPYCFAAIFSLFGVLFVKRAMAISLVYGVIVEFGLSNVPALVHQLTVSYSLRSLALRLCDSDLRREFAVAAGDPDRPVAMAVSLALITLGSLALACVILERRQIVQRPEE